MPPKSTPASKSTGPSKEELEAINTYLTQKPDFEKLIAEAKQNPPPQPEKRLTDYDHKIQQAVAASTEAARKAVATNSNTASTKLHHPDSVKGYKSSAQQAADKTVASVNDHEANPGPVMAQDLGEPASKEELRKRAEELNK